MNEALPPSDVKGENEGEPHNRCVTSLMNAHAHFVGVAVRKIRNLCYVVSRPSNLAISVHLKSRANEGTNDDDSGSEPSLKSEVILVD